MLSNDIQNKNVPFLCALWGGVGLLAWILMQWNSLHSAGTGAASNCISRAE